MPTVESYIGSPSVNPYKLWHVLLEDNIQTNLDSVCELAVNLLGAKSCAIVANYPEHKIKLAHYGESLNVSDTELALYTSNECRLIEIPQQNSHSAHSYTWRVTAPIILFSKLQFGWLIFDKKNDQPLSQKEMTTLEVLQKNIVNHLKNRKKIIEQEKINELQATISKLNRDFIFVKDEEFKIVYANDAFLNMYPAHLKDKVIGFTTIESFDEEDAEAFLAQDKIAFETGQSKVIQKLHAPNGQYITVETTKKRFEDSTGAPYIMCVCRDLSEIEGLINKLTKANKDLDEFTSIASHDLKAPLNAIKRLLEWISDDCKDLLPQEHAENFQLVISRANRMQTLLEDLLKYARIDQCDVTLTSISLESVFEDVAQLLDIPKSITVTVDTSNTLINIPAVPFKTVILNLISNAIKHNNKEHGEVNISLKQSVHHYIIEVSDNGPGIDPKYFSLIFELFQTLRSRDEIEGTGIGLSVVKKHVTNFGGKVEVSSDGKSGTTFTVFWPKNKQNHTHSNNSY